MNLYGYPNQLHEPHAGNVGVGGIILNQILTVDTGAYADGDLLSDTVALEPVSRVPGGRTWLVSVHVLDESDQGQPFDIVFLDEFNSLGTINSAPNITDGNARKICGKMSVPAAAYLDLGGCRIATITAGTTDGNLPLLLQTPQNSMQMFMATISRGTGTYGAFGLRLRLGFSWD